MVPRLHRLLVITESTDALLGNLFELAGPWSQRRQRHFRAGGSLGGGAAMLRRLPQRCFPPPSSVDEADPKLDRRCFIVRDANRQALAYVYFEEEPGRRAAAKLLPRDGARRIAANIDKLPELLLLPGRCRIFATVLKQNRALFLTTVYLLAILIDRILPIGPPAVSLKFFERVGSEDKLYDFIVEADL